MKQMPFNVVVSLFVLAAVFFVANQGLPNANASTPEVPDIVIDGTNNGHLLLHGFGFRPGSIVGLELKPRAGGNVATGANVWVDSKGSFTAQFDSSPIAEQVASLGGGASFSWQDWVVIATSNSGTISIPLRAGNLPQQ